jgi:hypothetical protein
MRAKSRVVSGALLEEAEKEEMSWPAQPNCACKGAEDEGEHEVGFAGNEREGSSVKLTCSERCP